MLRTRPPISKIPLKGVGSVPTLITKIINFNDTVLGVPIATGIPWFTVRFGRETIRPVLVEMWLEVLVAWNGTSPVLTLGTSTGSYADILSAGEVTEATPGFYYGSIRRMVQFPLQSALTATSAIIGYKFTATTPTTGKARIYAEITPLF